MNRQEETSLSVGALIRRNLPPALQLALKLAEMERTWPQLVGPGLAPLTRPVSVDRSGLVVVCRTPAAAQMITMTAGSVLRRISRRWHMDLPGIRPVVARLDESREIPEQVPRRILPRQETVEECYGRIRAVIDRDDTALALARLEALYKARFGGQNADPAGKEKGKTS